MLNTTYVAIALLAAFFMYRVLTRPDPHEERILHTMSHVLNDPQYRVKSKYED